jgi:ABC-2 type transport system permease protein
VNAGLVHDVKILGERSIRHWTRNPASIAGAVAFPLLFFTLFNLVMRKLMRARGFDYAQLLPATVVVQAMFFTAMSAAYYIAADRHAGMLARLRSLPIAPFAPVLGRSIGDVSRASVSVVILTVVGIVAGMRFDGGIGGAAVFLLAPLLFVLVVAMWMGLIGLIAPSPDAAVSIASIPYLPLLMLSTGFAPVDDFPGWLEPFVRHQPVTLTIDVLRAGASGGLERDRWVPWLIWMIVLGVAAAIVAGRAFRRAS